MQNKFPTIILLLLLSCCILPESYGFDNSSRAPLQVKIDYSSQSSGNFFGGHDTITAEGMLLKKQVHFGNQDFKDWAETKALPPLRIGAHDEDTNEIFNFILRDPPLGPNGWGDFYKHFYDVRLGDDAENAIGLQATKAVKDYLQKIRELTHCTSKGFESLPPGDKARVYDYLGRITHLYQDMFCPSHVKVEVHPFVNPFEKYINDRWGEIVRSSSFQDRVTASAYLNGNYDIGVSINPILAMKDAAAKSIGFWSEEALCDQWDEQRASCLLVNDEKLQQNVDALVPDAILSTAGYIDSIYRAAKAEPDYGNTCVPKPLQGPGGDHPDDRFDVSDSFYWQDHFKLSDLTFTNLLMRTALKKGKTGVWYRKRIKELYGIGRHSAPDTSERNRVYSEFKVVDQKLRERDPAEDWLTSPDIALFAYGFYDPAISLMLKIKEPVRFLDLDFDPSIVRYHPVMLIPTAGFAGFEQSATLKAKLEEYVRSGGTLVVFAQQLGHHWNILPTPFDTATGEATPVSGYGYQQDQNCQQGSVFIETNHAILSSFTSATIDVGVDGYFSSYPDNSVILLRRTANGQPAMILYPYGNGHVLATTLYSDFAFSHSQASKSETNLVANIISWAKKPTELPQVRPGETVSFNISVTNNLDSDAASTKLKIYTPDRSTLLAEQIIAGHVPAFESTVISTQFTIPGNGLLGIYHADYVLSDAQGSVIQPQTETDSGRFVVSNPSRVGSPDKPIWFAVTTTSQNVPLGSTFDYTFHVYNNSDETRHLTIRSVFGHTKRPHSWNVTAQPRTVATVTGSDIFEDRAYLYDTMRASLFDESNQAIGRYELSFKGFFPHATIAVSSNKSVYSNNEDLVLRTMATSGQPGAYSIKTMILGPDNALAFDENRSVNIVPGTATIIEMQHHIPANSNPGSYLVRSEIWQESRLLASAVTSFELPRSQIVIKFDEPHSFKTGANTLSFNLRNNGRVDIRSGTFDVQFYDPQGRVVYAGLHSFSLSAGQTSTITIPIFIPSLYFGDYTLNYTQSDETKNGSFVSITIPNSATVGLLLDKFSYRIRESANVFATIINTGKFDLHSLYATLGIYAIDFSNTNIISLPKGQSVTLNFSIPIPETAPAGSHSTELSLILPSGSNLWQGTSISIPGSSLVVHYNGPNAVNPGDIVTHSLENTGGVDTEYSTERLSLTDDNGVTIHHGTASGIIRAGETKNFHGFQIPLQVARGDVMLNISVKDSKTGQSANFMKSLTLNGVESRIQTRTNKDLYVSNETVTNITDIVNGGSLIENASLDLLVYRLKAGVGGQFSHFLPRGWLPLTQPTGVASDSEGYLYVVDPEDKRLIKIDKNGHFIKEFDYNKSCRGGANDLCMPFGVAVGPEGSVYVVESGGNLYTAHNRIHKFDRDGNLLRVWGYYDIGNGYGLNRPSGIAVSRDGYVYVTDTDNHRVVKFDSEGTFVLAWGSAGNGGGQFVYPRGIAIDNNDSIYVTDGETYYYPYGQNNRVQKFDSNGNFITQWGGRGSSDGLFLSPSGIAVDSEGYVYVSDTDERIYNSHRVQKFNSNGIFIRAWGGEGRSEGKLYYPKGLAIGSDGLIYVADSGNSRIQKFTADGDFVTLWGGDGSTNGFFEGPKGLGVDANGFLYVADYYNERIQKFDKNGSYVKQWGSEGTGNGQFQNGPESIAVSKEGFVYAANGAYSDARVQKFDSEGNFLTSWGSIGTGDGQFTGLQRMAINAGGFVYVSDTGTKRVQKFDSNGTFLAKWGSPGNGPGQFTEPRSIATSPDGSVFVAEPYSIQKFDSNGMFLLKWGTQGTDDGQFNSIKTITVDQVGFVYVVDFYPIRVQKFDGAGNFIAKWDEGEGDGMDVFHAPTGMAMDSEGFILIADGYNNRIRKLTQFGTEEIFRKNMVFSQSGNSNQQYITDLGTLSASGKLYCEATMKNSLGQILSKSLYPFYVASESTALLISVDKKIYKPGETIRISGEVVNMSDTPLSNHSLSIIQHSVLGSTEVLRINCALPASGSFPFSATFSALQEGAYALTAMVHNNNIKVVDAIEHYEVRVPMLSTEVVCPNVVGDQPFSLDVVIGNTGNIDVAVNLTSSIDGQTFALRLAPGASKVITYQQQITQDALYRFTVTGDINATFEKIVFQGLASSIYAYALSIYPEGSVVIPISIGNTGLLDGKVTVDIDLQPSGFSIQRDYFIPQGGIATDNLVFDLAEGDYTLTLTSQAPSASKSASFSVRKEDKVTIAPIVVGAPTGGLISISTEVTSHGYRNVEGTIQLSVSNIQGVIAWQANQAVSIPVSQTPTPVPISFSFSPAAIPPGAYTVSVALLNNGGQELASQSMPLTITGGNVRISQMPSPQTVNAGADATFLFKVANTGGREVSAELTLKSGDFINLTRRELINPGEERDIQFAFPIPSDLEEKDYFTEYELKSEGIPVAKGQVRYHVAGINIAVIATLDKEHYRNGETAHLNIIVNQQGGGSSQNLFARVNYAGHEDKQSFVLSGSQNLSFNIPLTAITGEKLFYGVYDEGGRSIHLNSLYIYKTGDAFNITTNKQVYNQGETVTATIAGTGTGTMTLSAPGPYEETFIFSGSTTKGFVLPTVATAGTYFIEGRLATASGETFTASKPFDIAGISVKVKEALLDKGKYLPGETLRLSMRIESNSDIPATLKVWSVDPDMNSTFLGENQLSLTRTEHLVVANNYNAIIESSGIHKVIYGIYSDRLLLSSGNLSFDAGDAVILGITTDRNDYPLGSEAVAVRLNLYGTTDATLTLNVNGAPVHTEAINLNGFTTTTIQLPPPGPGVHTLEGALAVGGLTSKKETKFLYGTNLPDLTADLWGSGTAIGKGRNAQAHGNCRKSRENCYIGNVYDASQWQRSSRFLFCRGTRCRGKPIL